MEALEYRRNLSAERDAHTATKAELAAVKKSLRVTEKRIRAALAVINENNPAVAQMDAVGRLGVAINRINNVLGIPGPNGR